MPIFTVTLPAALQADKYPINVLDFGAVGNGSHDDTAAIQTAIVLSETQFGTPLYFPPGSYSVSTLAVSKPGRWIGAGPGNSIIRSNIVNTSLVTVGILASETIFEDLQLNANDKSAYALHVDDFTSFIFSVRCRNVNIVGGTTASVYMGHFRNRSQFINCNILSGTGAPYSAFFESNGDHRWTDNDLAGGSNAVLHMFNCSDSYFTNCFIFDGVNGIDLEDHCYGIQFIGGSVDTNSQDGFFYNPTTIQETCNLLLGVKFSGNSWVTPATNSDIRVKGDNLAIVGCQFFSPNHAGRLPPDYNIRFDGGNRALFSGNNFASLAAGPTAPFGVAITNDFSKLWESDKHLYKLPVIDPGVSGEWWNNANVINVDP